MRKLITGVAALALATGTAMAAPGGGHGNANEKGKPEAGARQDGREQPAKAQGNGHTGHQGRIDSPAEKVASPDQRGKPDRAETAKRDKPAPPAAASNGNARRDAAPGIQHRDAKRAGADSDRGKPDRVIHVADRANGKGRVVERPAYIDHGANHGLIDGCPPGLARKHNGCTPPGLAKQRSFPANWWGYRTQSGGQYYYGDGYLYRTGSNGSILGYLPLLGGALAIGNAWPGGYQPVPVPEYYVDYYNLGPANSYRYADDVLYRVNPQTDMITSIAALLTGDRFGVGQPMPAGYDIYNVPYAYRGQYPDTPDAMYRYSDGYVYQVDPTTQLVQAAIQLLT